VVNNRIASFQKFGKTYFQQETLDKIICAWSPTYLLTVVCVEWKRGRYYNVATCILNILLFLSALSGVFPRHNILLSVPFQPEYTGSLPTLSYFVG
jgi:hypothetical protein